MAPSKNLSRRSLLKMFGIAIAGVGVSRLGPPARAVRAQTTPAFGSFYRFTLGDFELTAIQDGFGAAEPAFVAANAPEEAAEELEELNLPSAILPVTINCLLVNTGDRLILMDTGTDSIPNPAITQAGFLNPTLELIGVAREDVTDVVISHFHPDHIAGVAGTDGLYFPNAMHYLSQPEYDFLQTTTGNADFDALIGLANSMLAPAIAADQFQTYNDGDEVVPGVQAVFTPGHTIGHSSFLINSGSASLMSVVDAAIHQELSVRRPDFNMSFDAVPDLAVETRRALLQRIADEQLWVFGYHFTFPGLGYIDTDGDSFRFVPQS
jgi:glyoxylase-like metal-dependent hydrolase (beta-lactamase superfamily II)